MGTRENVVPLRRKMTVQHNIDTGETNRVIVEEAPDGRRIKARKKLFVMFDMDMVRLLDMTALQWGIFMQIAHALEQDTGIARITGPEIATALGSHQPTVNRAMQDMLKRKIIHKEGNGRYRISLHLVYRGDKTTWENVAMDEDVPQMRRDD